MAPKAVASPNSTEPIDIEGKKALALLGAWRGVYHFLNGRVEKWEVVSPSIDNPDGSVIARGFTVDIKYDPNQIIADISGRERRVYIFPAFSYLNGATPAPFTDPQDMTNFMISYLKGSVDEDSARTPVYFRTAVQDYKAANGLKARRGQ